MNASPLQLNRRRALRNRHVWPAILLASVGLAYLAGCGEPAATPGRTIVATVPPLQFIVEQIGGDAVRVVTLLPPSANPTTHAPTVADRRNLAQASLIVTVGHPAFPFERTWLGRLLEERPRLLQIAATPDELVGEDPHVWTDPKVVADLSDRLLLAMVELWPESREAFTRNHAAFQMGLALLQAEIKGLLEPVRGRPFFVFHPAWGHLAKAHGLEQVALEHDHKEPGPHAFAELIARARQEKPRVIFAQPQFDPSAAEILAKETGARVETLDPLAYDWSANMQLTAERLAEALVP